MKGMQNLRGKEIITHIQGSVEESPSGERVLSLDRPGANTPRPYPRTETTQGSFIVNLQNDKWRRLVQG